MPVVVTGGDEPLGAAVLAALQGTGELRAVVSTRSAQRALVQVGVRAALVGLDDVDTLAAVMTGAHTVVHAAGPEPADTLPAVREAAGRVRVVRVVVVSAVAVERPGLVVVAPGPDAVAEVLRADDRQEGGSSSGSAPGTA